MCSCGKTLYDYAGLWPSYIIFSAIFLWKHRILTVLWRKATLCLICLLTPLLLAVKISTRTVGQSIFRGCYIKLFYAAKEKLTPRFCLSHHSAQMLIIRLFQLCQKPSCAWRVISEKSGYHNLPVRAKWGGLMNSNTKIPRVVVLTESCFKRTIFLYRDFSKETMFIFSVENWL